jgi:hypothetical protein
MLALNALQANHFITTENQSNKQHKQNGQTKTQNN